MRSAISFVVWAALAAAPRAAAERLLTEEESVRLALARAEAAQLRRALVGSAEADAASREVEGDAEVRRWQLPALDEWAARGDRDRARPVVPSAELTRVAEAAYRAGEGGILELLDAYKGAPEAETTALDLEWSARQVRVELDQISGWTTR